MEQPLNERQWRFLNAADRAAGTANRFRWREVGAALGYSEEESRQITSLLDRLVAIVLPTDREGQLLPLGKAMARQPWRPPEPKRVNGRSSAADRQRAPAGRHGKPATGTTAARRASSSHAKTRGGRHAPPARHAKPHHGKATAATARRAKRR